MHTDLVTLERRHTERTSKALRRKELPVPSCAIPLTSRQRATRANLPRFLIHAGSPVRLEAAVG